MSMMTTGEVLRASYGPTISRTVFRQATVGVVAAAVLTAAEATQATAVTIKSLVANTAIIYVSNGTATAAAAFPIYAGEAATFILDPSQSGTGQQRLSAIAGAAGQTVALIVQIP